MSDFEVLQTYASWAGTAVPDKLPGIPFVNIPPQTGQQNGGNRSRVTVEMSPGVRLRVQAVE